MPGAFKAFHWQPVRSTKKMASILRSSGVMTTTALKEAAQVGFPRDKIVGPTPTCAEQDVGPAGEAAMGFIYANWHGWGTRFPLIQEILQSVYARGKGAGPERDVGTAPWIRGMLRGLLVAEALRTAMRHFGHQPLTGAQVQWGFEHLSLTAASLKELGAEGLPAHPLVPRP
jgi:branched-chain amino acid transport system substrate-binding protein